MSGMVNRLKAVAKLEQSWLRTWRADKSGFFPLILKEDGTEIRTRQIDGRNMWMVEVRNKTLVGRPSIVNIDKFLADHEYDLLDHKRQMQQVFDRIVLHLFTQQRVSVRSRKNYSAMHSISGLDDNSGEAMTTCAYHGQNGLSCAIGFMLDPAKVEKYDVEEKSVMAIVSSGANERTRPLIHVLRDAGLLDDFTGESGAESLRTWLIHGEQGEMLQLLSWMQDVHDEGFGIPDKLHLLLKWADGCFKTAQKFGLNDTMVMRMVTQHDTLAGHFPVKPV